MGSPLNIMRLAVTERALRVPGSARSTPRMRARASGRSATTNVIDRGGGTSNAAASESTNRADWRARVALKRCSGGYTKVMRPNFAVCHEAVRRGNAFAITQRLFSRIAYTLVRATGKVAPVRVSTVVKSVRTTNSSRLLGTTGSMATMVARTGGSPGVARCVHGRVRL